MVESNKPNNIFLVNRTTNTSIPLLRTLFDVTVSMGFADILVHQVYENSSDLPLDIAFIMPYPDSNFDLNKIEVDFTLEDGTVKYVET
jgi:hypothetical protein